MWAFGILFSLFVFFTSLILPWVNRSKIGELRDIVARLQDEVARLRREGVKASAPSPMKAAPPILQERPEKVVPAPVFQETKIVDDFADDEKSAPEWKPEPVAVRTEQKTFEQQFGGQAFVWLGGIALALAGFFLVKYSIESGFLTEQVRVVLGLAFGVALVGGSYIVRQHPRIADSTRISQALAGAGIADLYGCLFAATTLYHLVPSWLGFTGMVGVTGMTLLLSLRYGAPIAMLGLIGGFVTPMLVHGEPHAPLLFGYLYLVFGSLIAVCRQRNWWWLSIPATVVAFLWVVFWIVTGLAAADAIWLALFLIAISATVVVATNDRVDEDYFGPFNWLRYIAIGGALLLMGTITYTAQFGAFEWDMFGLLSVGALALAWFDNRTYGFAPWLAMGANAVMLLSWDYANPTAFAVAVAIFGTVFTASGYLLAGRSKNPVSWTGLSAVSAIIYYLLAYHRLDASISSMINAPDWLFADQIWACMAFALATIFAIGTTMSHVVRAAVKQRHKLQAIFTVAATGFLSLGFAILLHQEYLAFAIAAEMLAISWIDDRADIPALRYIAQALAILFGILILPEMLAMISSSFDTYGGTNGEKLHNISSLVFRFGLPSIMFAGASQLLRTKRDDEFVMALEFGAMTLIAATGYNLIGMIVGQESQTAFFARGVFTDLLLILGLAALRVSRQYERPAVEWGGLIAIGLASLRIAGFDFLIHDPLWSHQMIGEFPLINGLILAYGLPAVLVVPIRNELVATRHVDVAFATKVAGFVLGFVFVSLNVRQFYHGSYLDTGMVSNAEIYAYSAAWLALGITLLFAGTMRQDGMMRVASLLIMLLTVGKVFLYDASELTGLWRVVSFLGLGLSLLGLSWFYSRFVFSTKSKN